MLIERKKNNIFVINSIEIGIKDNMYNLNDLRDAFRSNNEYVKPFHSVIRNKGFMQLVSKLSNIHFNLNLSSIYSLRKKNMFRVEGKGENKISYCDYNVICALIAYYSDESLIGLINILDYDKSKI